jgi:mono/diheme cytochrome c family protein
MNRGSIACLIVLLALAACSARRGEVVGKPVAVDTETERLGRDIFMKHCHRCHPRGESGLGPALNNKPLSRGMVAFQIRNGIGAMPAYSAHQINDTELDALVEYVVTLRTQK